ncbi:hypothetical protein KIN20_022141 [Parelaphostrongylus tenuis]|uniref:Uncharacterized protein n=1 Tax=Parelaphostrongylus tenuis TaxID=148309 RepID=A0AAD5QS17_PARTN|nr:hypothetical protein KIN20_022141 [Parelaphostrongylus tenuis]
MARSWTDPIISLLLVTILTVSGCGALPGGLVSTRDYNVTDFKTLPIPMVYTNDSNVAFRFPDISTSKEQARSFVERVVKHATTAHGVVITDASLGPPRTRQRTITGHIMTTNIIMANWPTAMWQGLVDRAIQMLAYGPLERHFFSATVTVGERY